MVNTERGEQMEAELRAIESETAVLEARHAKLEKQLAIELGIGLRELREQRRAAPKLSVEPER